MRPPATPDDLIALAGQARDLIHGQLRAGAPAGRVETLIRARLPKAWNHLDHHALVALARRPPDGGCHWCAAFVAAVGAGRPEPTATEANRELLGSPCPACRRRQQIDRARAQARRKPPPRLPPRRAAVPVLAGTGVLWAAGQDPPEVAALVAAATRAAGVPVRRAGGGR